MNICHLYWVSINLRWTLKMYINLILDNVSKAFVLHQQFSQFFPLSVSSHVSPSEAMILYSAQGKHTVWTFQKIIGGFYVRGVLVYECNCLLYSFQQGMYVPSAFPTVVSKSGWHLCHSLNIRSCKFLLCGGCAKIYPLLVSVNFK